MATPYPIRRNDQPPPTSSCTSCTFGALVPNVEWTHILDVANNALELYEKCECSAEDEIGYQVLLLHTLKQVSATFDTLQDRITSFPANEEESSTRCRLTLKGLLSEVSAYYNDLIAALPAEGPTGEADTLAPTCQWQLTSGEVESYVHRADQLLLRLGGFQAAFGWYVVPSQISAAGRS